MGRPKKRGFSMAGNPNCPRPDKRGFFSEEHLRKRLCRNPEESGMEPYLCKCGYWHMGHVSNYTKRKVSDEEK